MLLWHSVSKCARELRDFPKEKWMFETVFCSGADVLTQATAHLYTWAATWGLNSSKSGSVSTEPFSKNHSERCDPHLRRR